MSLCLPGIALLYFCVHPQHDHVTRFSLTAAEWLLTGRENTFVTQ
jgi:hypothetical protein